MILFDAHVHLWPAFAADRLLQAARDNFLHHLSTSPSSPPTMALFLADTARAEGFALLRAMADRGERAGNFLLMPTEEDESLLALDPNRPEERLVLLAGRQIVTGENIEVLSLASTAAIPDGQPLGDTVALVKERGGLAVLPWGVGKWLGIRGRTVATFLAEAPAQGLFVGDIGGRPRLWPASRIFAQAAERGIALLPGSDPLPLPGEERRVGSCGASLVGSCTGECPAALLRQLLCHHALAANSFATRPNALSFIATQLALRL